MYARPTVDGRKLDFGVSGKLIMNGLVMYDRQSDTLWSQVLGRAVWGALEGRDLDVVPSHYTTWDAWKAVHPDTEALAKPDGLPDPYADYYASRSAGVHGETLRDARLEPKALVAGAVIGGRPVAYPVADLASAGHVNDTVGGVPVLVAHDESSGTTMLYERWLDGRALRFADAADEWLGQRHDLPTVLLRDEATGSLWDGWTGLATDGPLEGRRLEPIAVTPAFWFAWKDYHPDTLLFGAGP